MTYPTDDLTNANLDAGTDDPSIGRTEINAAVLKVKAMIAATTANGANDACKLDVNGQVTANSTFPELAAYNLIAALTSDAQQAILDLDNLAADKQGETFTGNIDQSMNDPRSNIRILNAGGTQKVIVRDSDNFVRSIIGFNDAADRFDIELRNAAGSVVTNFTLDETGNVTVNGAAPTAIDHLTRKDYVDDNFPLNEEGTWTPVLSDGANDATMVSTAGEYIKQGNVVYVTAHVQISSLVAASGSLRVKGLPFTARAPVPNASTCGISNSGGLNLTLGDSITGGVNGTAIHLYLYGIITGGASFMTDAKWTATGKIDISGFYFV